MLNNTGRTSDSPTTENAFRSYQLLFAKYIYESGAQNYSQQPFRQEYQSILGAQELERAESPVIESFEADCQRYRAVYIQELYETGRVTKDRLIAEQQNLRLGDSVVQSLVKGVRQEFHHSCDIYRELYARDLRDDGLLDEEALDAERMRWGLGFSIVQAIASTEQSTFASDRQEYSRMASQLMHSVGNLASDELKSRQLQFHFGPALVQQIHQDVSAVFHDHQKTYQQQFSDMLRHNGAITEAERQKLQDLCHALGNLNPSLLSPFETEALERHSQNVAAYHEEARSVIQQFTGGNVDEATVEERESLQALSHWYELSPAIAAQIERTVRDELKSEGLGSVLAGSAALGVTSASALEFPTDEAISVDPEPEVVSADAEPALHSDASIPRVTASIADPDPAAMSAVDLENINRDDRDDAECADVEPASNAVTSHGEPSGASDVTLLEERQPEELSQQVVPLIESNPGLVGEISPVGEIESEDLLDPWAAFEPNNDNSGPSPQRGGEEASERDDDISSSQWHGNRAEAFDVEDALAVDTNGKADGDSDIKSVETMLQSADVAFSATSADGAAIGGDAERGGDGERDTETTSNTAFALISEKDLGLDTLPMDIESEADRDDVPYERGDVVSEPSLESDLGVHNTVLDKQDDALAVSMEPSVEPCEDSVNVHSEVSSAESTRLALADTDIDHGDPSDLDIAPVPVERSLGLESVASEAVASEAVASESVALESVASGQKTKSRRWLTLGALLLLAVGGAIALYRNQGPQPAPVVSVPSNATGTGTLASDDGPASTDEGTNASGEEGQGPATANGTGSGDTSAVITPETEEVLTEVQQLIQDRQVVGALELLASVPKNDTTMVEIDGILQQVFQQSEAYYNEGLYDETTVVINTMENLFANHRTSRQARLAFKEWQNRWHANLATLKVAEDALVKEQYDSAIAEAQKVTHPGLQIEVASIIDAAIQAKQAQAAAEEQARRAPQGNRSPAPSGSPAPRASAPSVRPAPRSTPRPTPRTAPRSTPKPAASTPVPSYYKPDPL